MLMSWVKSALCQNKGGEERGGGGWVGGGGAEGGPLWCSHDV